MIQVFPSNPEWNHVLFKIQLILADPSVYLTRVIKYKSQFDSKYLTHMKIDCAINATNLSERDIEVLKYQNASKYVFEAGHIRLDSQVSSPMRSKSVSELSERRKGNVKKILLFKLAVDQCMPIHKSGVNQLINISQFPVGIDTIYVSDSKEQLNIYPHKYRVRDRGQCCFEYEVDFVIKGIQNTQKWDPKSILCQFCQTTNAVYYCPQDKQLYCAKCYQQLHKTTKKKAHQKISISPFNSTQYCSFHQKQRFTYYCLQCMDIRCDTCIKNQVHKGDRNHSQIMLLTDLQKSLKQRQKSFLKQAKNHTKNLIKSSQDVLEKLNKNYQSQKFNLQQIFAAKLAVIRQQSNKKILKAIFIHSQLKRKYDQLIWVENFLTFCQDFMTVEDNIHMKDSFFVYLQGITGKQYYLQCSKKLEELG